MRKDRNEAAATTATVAANADKTLIAQQESISENEESDTITDHSSSMSEHKKRHIGAATQFSVQRSDTDCLRMRISAIRPTVSASTELKRKSSTHKTALGKAATTKMLVDKANNNTLDDLKIKLSQHNKKQVTSNNMLVRSGRERSVPIDSKTLTMSLAQSAPCLSDATESGCSEATTIAAAIEKSTKKVKIKRKKAPAKSNETKHKTNKKSHLPPAANTVFSSDSDDEPLQKLQQQRAPRLLITAINSKNTQLKTALVSNADKIGLSSSDNELPDLVSAAIKRVESDTDDTGGECSNKLSSKTKHLPQYQSTLLQDFMEKTQMLGQTSIMTPAKNISPTDPITTTAPTAIKQSNQEPTPNPSVKKRRGRPRKIVSVQTKTEMDTTAVATAVMASTTTINESADSGVISTTSTAQSTSPSPRLSCVVTKSESCTSPTKSATEIGTNSKPKIDFVNLDKRMYATERVLYPPPRNKRRQSSSVGAFQQQLDKKASAGPLSVASKLAKEELQLDPVWRKIDVNKKFRRPSVSGYKSDGGGGNTTICSKILAAQSGYVSDYGSAHPRSHHHNNHNSGYKSDASGKSRFSTRSCASTRRSRAKSCGYRSDCKEGDKTVMKSNKFRRKRRMSSLMRHHSKSVGNLNDEHDILQLAGLSLGQSSEESNEYVCKPSLKCLPTTSVSKKYGEINRFVATGEYFGRGAAGSSSKRLFEDVGLQDGFRNFSGKLNLLRKNSLGSELAADMLSHTSRKIKSRRSSAASYCSSYYSGVSKVKRRRRRRSFRFPSSSKVSTIDSKLLTEIDIITNTFATLCRIHHTDKASPGGATLKEKEKPFVETSSSISKLQPLSSVGKRETRDKRSLKKRKLSENLDFALLAASVGGSGSSLTPSSGSTKRRHKKANSSSPDDHKLPLKKRHYLLTPGEKSTEAAAVAAKLFANNAEALAAVAAAAKSSASSLTAGSTSQQRFSTKNSKTAITPKKRHLLQTSLLADEGGGSLKGGSNHSSPLRISVETVAGVTSSKLLDISPALSTGSTTKPSTDAQVHKKRTRLEGLVTKIANHSDVQPLAGSVKLSAHAPQIDSENSSCPPPGVFEPTVELEIQIPPISKLTEAAAIITKSEVDSPLLLELNKTFPLPSTKVESGRVVEALLNKTGGNLLLKRKRKKINRTGFPTVRRKKRKINDQLLLDVTPDIIQQVEQSWSTSTTGVAKPKASPAGICDRVPHTGEASNTFLERENRAPPRLSVVSLDRLQGTTTKQDTTGSKRQQKRQEKFQKEKPEGVVKTLDIPKNETVKLSKVSNTDDKLGNRGSGGRRSLKAVKSSVPSPDKQTSKSQVTKSETLNSVQKVEKTFTTPSTNGAMSKKGLDVRRLLPAGIDPKINFSCKIRLKRRSSLHGIALAAVKDTKVPLTETINKDPHSEHLEHDVLPLSDIGGGAESEAASDTSDEKSSAASTIGGRKNVRWKKTYLTAGLFSDYFKYLEPPTVISKKQQKKLIGNLKEAPSLNSAVVDTTALQQPLLPPPPYCEKYFRRTQLDFELPYDIWWAYKNAKLPARVTVPSWNYRKIRTNIYAESVRPNMAGFDHPTCNCKPDVGCGDDCLNRLVYTECSPSCCPTRDKCRNQKIQRHEVAPGVERFMTENKGWGVRTNLPIKKGTYILEYVGEVVTEREFKDRMGTIYLNDTHHYCLHLDGGLVIDGHRMGSDGRFVNHSCQPNCEMQKWSVNGLSRMALFAARNIVENEELTYDYNFSLFNPSEGQPCRCNTPQCRGVIGGKSQRIKPLPIIEAIPIEPAKEPVQKGRQRKRIAKKNSAFLQSKDVVFTKVQQLSEKEKKYVKQHAVFLLRNFEKIRKYKRERGLAKTPPHTELKTQSPIPTPSALSPNTSSSAAVAIRRASTPASFAAQISALRSPRNMKTRGLALANSDPELEKMAKMAVILRDICTALEMTKDPNDDKIYVTGSLLSASTAAATISTNKKKKLAKPAATAASPSPSTSPSPSSSSSSLLLLQKEETLTFLTIQANIEKGFYKQPTEFDADMQLIIEEAKQSHAEDVAKLAALSMLSETYAKKKQNYYKQLLEVATESACKAFLGISEPTEVQSGGESVNTTKVETETAKIESTESTEADPKENTSRNAHSSRKSVSASPTEDIIRCICGLYKDEGLMIQCARCMVWQHTECTKADINADNYHCERCEPREVNREIPLEDFTEDGHRYYLSLLRGELHVRQGDTVYVLRDIPIKDEAGNIIPSKKHTYETIGEIDYSECDIFRVERLWKNSEGKRFIFGHHFLRPHETFHEPTRRFYPNEVVRVPLYEVVPIELVIGRCWVLDRTTFCKGRPMECEDDAHCYICELRVDRSARFFSKAKVTYPACTKSYAFRKFPEKLKISKTYAPHDVDPAMLKTKKQKTDLEQESSSSTPIPTARNEVNKTPPVVRKRQNSSSPATGVGSNVRQSPGTVQVITPAAPTVQTIKAKRSHLENVLKAMKLRMQKNAQLTNEPPLDLSYLLSGRGARQRKTNASSSATLANVPT